MKFEVKNRFSGKVQFEAEIECAEDASVSVKLGLAVKWAVKARAYLTGANLTRAYLAGAYLTGAKLAGADLADADLTGAYLTGAYLTGANLTGADLADADLTGAKLAGAKLAGANLTGADLADADLTGAYLIPSGVEKTDPPEPYERKPSADRFAERAARFRERNPTIPVIPDIDARILAAVEGGSGALEMGSWHTCETTHCRAASGPRNPMTRNKTAAQELSDAECARSRSA